MDIVKLFGTTDLYQILDVDRDATIQQSKFVILRIYRE